MFVKVSETYDLSTIKDRMAFVSIHTPKGSLIKRMWGGLLSQYKFARFHKCDVTMACASMLPADPLQVGVSGGDIAPQDMFNPILYKAVSNDSYTTLLTWMNNFMRSTIESERPTDTEVTSGPSVDSINSIDFLNGSTDIDQFAMYYALLANPDGFRKAMPQAGLQMRGLYPICYSLVSNVGYNPAFVSDSAAFPTSVPSVPMTTQADAGGLNSTQVYQTWMKGPACRMPRFNTMYFSATANKAGDGVVQGLNTVCTLDNAPVVPVGVIILPPAKLNQLYYRLKVTWTIELSELVSLDAYTNWSNMAQIGELAYYSDYVFPDTNATSLAMVDAADSTLTKIMEGA